MLGASGMSELEKAHQIQLVRLALERAAVRLEQRAGNKLYQQAWKIAAKMIREMKPELEVLAKH